MDYEALLDPATELGYQLAISKHAHEKGPLLFTGWG